MASVESSILRELTGSLDPAKFPNTMVDGLWDVWAFLSRLNESSGRAPVSPLGSASSGGPAALASSDPSEVALHQLTGSVSPVDLAPGWGPTSDTARSRWDRRYRTAAQLVDECQLLIASIARTEAPGPSPVPPPRPVMYPAPANMTAVANANGSISLDWSDVADAVGYRVFETASPNGVPNGDVKESQSRRGPFPNYRLYTYWVCAVFGDGTLSKPSATAAVELKAPALPPSTLPAGQSQGSLEWASNLAGEIIKAGAFKSTPWNTENGGSWPPPTVDAPGGRGGKAVRFSLPSHGKRIELEPTHRTFGGGGQAYFGFAFYLDESFPLALNDWQLIWQLHGNDKISPRFALQVRNNQLRVGDSTPLAEIEKKRWYSVVVRADFSSGVMQTWLDGKDTGNKNVGKSDPDYYLKFGYYRNPNIAAPGTVFITDWALGSGYGSVVPVR